MPIVVSAIPSKFGIDTHILRPSSTILPDHAHQRELIDAAIAVNEAPTLDEAFQALARAGLSLLDCDRLTVVAWNDGLSLGTIRADTGASLGEPVPAMDGSADAIRNELAYSGPPRIDGFSPSLAGSLQPFAHVVRVPLATAHGIATFHALWRDPLTDDAAVAAGELLRTLTRLEVQQQAQQCEYAGSGRDQSHEPERPGREHDVRVVQE